MKQVTVAYWTGSGNTQMMAEAVAEGARTVGAQVQVVNISAITPQQALEADILALGCPSMGAEVLEEGEMEPFVESLLKCGVSGKPMGLFGSYDWGDGQWMRDWTARMADAGAALQTEGLIIQNTPDAAGLDRCRGLGALLAGR